jgi:hypothetical protein
VKLRTSLAALFILIGLTAPIQGQYVPEAQPLLPWGPVDGSEGFKDGRIAVARHGSTLFVGGEFTLIGPPTGAAVAVDPATGVLTRGPAVVGKVNFAIPDGRGGWFIGGYFRFAGRVLQLARLDGNGEVDRSWNAPFFEGIPGDLLSGEVVQNRLFVGGLFDGVDGQPRSGVAALDAFTGTLVPWDPMVSGPLATSGAWALKHRNGALYIGGEFISVAGVPRQNLAAVDVQTARLLPFTGGVEGRVQSLSILGDTLYVGGEVYRAAGQPRSSAAAFSLGTGGLLPWAPQVGARVSKILAIPGHVFVAGTDLSVVNGQRRRGLAALDPESAALLPFDAGLDNFGAALGLDVSGNTLYVAGWFREAQGQQRVNAAAFDLSNGALLPWSPMIAGRPLTLIADANAVVIGGEMWSAGAIPRKGFARIDLYSGRPLPPIANIENVTAFLLIGNVMVMATATALEAYRADTMEALPWRPTINGRVFALATDGVRLFVGGVYTEIAGVSRQYLAAFDLATGVLLDWAPEPNDYVETIVVDGRRIYVGGRFRTFPGSARSMGAAIDAVTGEILGWNPRAEFYGPISALAVFPTHIVAAGDFNQLGGRSRDGVGSMDKAGGDALEIGPVSASRARVALAFRDTLLLGGSFSDVDGERRQGLAALSAQSGRLMPWAPEVRQTGIGSAISALDAADDFLIAAGPMISIDDRPAANLAVFPIARPGSPRALRATVAQAVATMSWEAGPIPLATSYQIEVGVTAGGSEIGVFQTTATEARGALPPGTYFVRVRGVSSAGAGAPSSEIILTIPAPAGPPQAPTGLVAAVADHAVTLSWQAAIGNPDTYIIEVGSAPGLSNLAVYSTGQLDTTLTTGAPPGTYSVRVRAVNAAGVGPASNEVVITVP